MISKLHWRNELERGVEKLVAERQVFWPAKLGLLNEVRTTFDTLVEYFLPAFPEVKRVDAEALAVFCRLYAGSVLLHDSVLDGDGCSLELGLASMRVGVMQYEGYQALHSIFPAQSPYWAQFRQYLAAHSEAFVQEYSFRSGRRDTIEFTEKLGLSIAVGKHSLAKTIVAALVELSGRAELLKPLCLSIDGVAVAFQMYDDLEDWRLDFKTKTPSVLLSRLSTFGEVPVGDERIKELFIRMSQEIYGHGHASYILRLALSSLEKESLVGGNELPLPWLALVKKIADRCESMLQEIDHATKKARVSR